MKSLISKSTVPLGVLFIAVMALIFVSVITFSKVTLADNGSATQSGRLITIHDRGVEKVVLTQAKTIGDALTEAGISIDANDTVEPAVDEELLASDYQVNIYRARPVTIIDGNVRKKIVTSYQTVSQIAASAGIQLYDEDITVLGQSSDIIADGAGLQLTITRATPFEFTLYGKTYTARTQAKTVGEMLIEKGIKLAENDRVTPSTGTKIANGLAVRVWREGKQTITVDESIDFETKTTEDANRDINYHVIDVAGEKGTRSVTYEVLIQDGVEVGRTEIASLVIKQPKTQAETIGVKGKYTTPSENENIIWNYLRAQGFSKIQTAGIMGNLQQEHQFLTTDVPGGYGIAQWTGGRRDSLMAIPNSDNIYVQLDFLMRELNATGIANAIKSNDSLSMVVYIFQSQFERCGTCRNDLRNKYASNILASHE